MRTLTKTLLGAAAVLAASCSSSSTPTLVQSLPAEQLDTLRAAIDAAGLSDVLDGEGEFTLLAPSEEAFAALPPGTIDFLLQPENQQALVDILLYHVIAGTFRSNEVAMLDSATTELGEDVLIDALGTDLYVNDARVVRANVQASNGILHVIDRVLIPPQDLVSTLESRGFNTLLAAVGAADLVDAVSGTEPLTILAPTDDAFAALPAGTLDTLLLEENVDDLVDILTYHVVDGGVRASLAASVESPKALNGVTLLFGTEGLSDDGSGDDRDDDSDDGDDDSDDGDDGRDDDGRDDDDDDGDDGSDDDGSDDDGSDDDDSDDGDDDSDDADDDDRDGDDADDDLTGTVQVTVNGVSIRSVNIPCTNGVIHVLDAVLLPPAKIPALASDAGLTTLVTAVAAAQLVETLDGDGPFTVFAPTNEAFEDLPEGALEILLDEANLDLLQDVLLYHVVADELTAREVIESDVLTAAQGDELDVDTDDGVEIEDVDVIATDILARNGIVHLIDEVLLPPDFALPAAASSATVQPVEQPQRFGDRVDDFLEFNATTLPVWLDAPDATSAGWNSFDESVTMPLLPNVSGSRGDAKLFVESPATVGTGRGLLASELELALRLSVPAEATPSETVVQVRFRGQTPEVALVTAGNEGVRPWLPSEVRQLESYADDAGELVVRWLDVPEGLPITGLDVTIAGTDTRIESIRLFSLD